MDLGSGTGILGIYLLTSNICELVVFTDINEIALLNTIHNLIINNSIHRGIVMLVDRLENLYNGYFNLIVSNPPYLPGIPGDPYDKALMGGEKGYETIIYFIDVAGSILKENGIFYLLFSSLSKPEIILDSLNKRGFKLLSKKSKHFFFEDLFLVEAVRK